MRLDVRRARRCKGRRCCSGPWGRTFALTLLAVTPIAFAGSGLVLYSYGVLRGYGVLKVQLAGLAQAKQMAAFEGRSARRLPEGLDYGAIATLSKESREKLARVRRALEQYARELCNWAARARWQRTRCLAVTWVATSCCWCNG